MCCILSFILCEFTEANMLPHIKMKQFDLRSCIIPPKSALMQKYRVWKMGTFSTKSSRNAMKCEIKFAKPCFLHKEVPQLLRKCCFFMLEAMYICWQFFLLLRSSHFHAKIITLINKIGIFSAFFIWMSKYFKIVTPSLKSREKLFFAVKYYLRWRLGLKNQFFLKKGANFV